MRLRTIMIFPKFKNMDIIDHIRNRYDPLADLVRPHVTLVFPFESAISNTELTAVLETRLATVKPFEMKLGGISMQEDAFGNYLFLNVLRGADELRCIHRALYENEFKEFDLGMDYIPHMTIGKLPTSELLESAYQDIKSLKDTFATVVDKVSVEMIGDKGESTIVIEKKLV